MNREEIMALTPERMRAEIAKTRGWRYYNIKDKNDDYPPFRMFYIGVFDLGENDEYEVEELKFPEEISNNTRNWETEQVPDWTKDMNSAWELFEELFSDTMYLWKDMSGKWRVSITDSPVEGIAETPQLAICRAWLILKNQAS